MVFKLVRIDISAPSKIELKIGTHVIGRGKFLHNDDTDKRVSRSHAELEITANSLILKSLHQNPCFYIKKDTEETQLLKQDCTVSLHSGDKFGLIPEHFWYEVLQCLDLENQGEAIVEKINGINAEKVLKNKEGGEKADVEELKNIEQSNAVAEPSSPMATGNVNSSNNEAADPNTCSSPSLMSSNLESTEDYDFQPKVPAARDTSPPATTCHSSLEPSSVNVTKYKTEPVDESEGPSNPQVSSVSDANSPVKRCHSSSDASPVDLKKVKTEPVDAKAGPSNNEPPSSDADSNVPAPASPMKPTVPPRERCIYGANCYRRNPAHAAQFSHPGTADWGGGARGVCPYGRACTRRDPRHWAAHDHPPGTRAPGQDAPRPGKRQKRRQYKVSHSDSDSGEDALANGLIVTGKRARKTVNRQDLGSWESEDEDEDPYQTDDEDEWQPSSDVQTSQDFSQDL